MSCAELYDKAMHAYTDPNETFNAHARNWIMAAEDAPFENAEAKELFYQAKRYCRIWMSGAINARISRLRMFECVGKIAEMGLPNPYPKEEPEEIKEETEEPAEETVEVKKAEEEKAEEKPEVQHILGVIPEPPSEEKAHLFSKRKKR